MSIVLVNTADDISLPEKRVGMGNKSCTYPGIQQCFAIAGWTAGGAIGTHVTPGSTKQELNDTFDYLKQLGGKSVRYWYVVGPFVDHFATTTALWKSVKDIQTTFDKFFKNNANNRYILDAREQRKIHTWGINIRAEHRAWEGMIRFSYAPAMGKGSNTYNAFSLNDFVPF
jgi:hypothetical protein